MVEAGAKLRLPRRLAFGAVGVAMAVATATAAACAGDGQSYQCRAPEGGISPACGGFVVDEPSDCPDECVAFPAPA